MGTTWQLVGHQISISVAGAELNSANHSHENFCDFHHFSNIFGEKSRSFKAKNKERG